MEKYDGVILKPDLDEALEHYGVKGMKWKKRKHPKEAARQKRAAEDLNSDSARKETINRQLDDSGIASWRRAKKKYGIQNVTTSRRTNKGKRHTSMDGGIRVYDYESSKTHKRPVLDTSRVKERKANKNKQKSKLWK